MKFVCFVCDWCAARIEKDDDDDGWPSGWRERYGPRSGQGAFLCPACIASVDEAMAEAFNAAKAVRSGSQGTKEAVPQGMHAKVVALADELPFEVSPQTFAKVADALDAAQAVDAQRTNDAVNERLAAISTIDTQTGERFDATHRPDSAEVAGKVVAVRADGQCVVKIGDRYEQGECLCIITIGCPTHTHRTEPAK